MKLAYEVLEQGNPYIGPFSDAEDLTATSVIYQAESVWDDAGEAPFLLEISCPHDDLESMALLTLGDEALYLPQEILYRICEGILAGRDAAKGEQTT